MCIVEKIAKAKTKNDKTFARVLVSDGLMSTTLVLWENDLEDCDFLEKDAGVKAWVNYDKERDSFTLQRRNFALSKLETIEDYNARIAMQGYDVDTTESY